MIELTKYKENFELPLKKLMMQEGLNFDEISLCLETTYVVLEKEEVLGFGYYNMYGQELYLDNLYIKKSERLNYFGDSLFRTILNALQLQDIKEVFMRKNEIYDVFLQKEEIALIDDRYVIDLNEFFNRKCRGDKQVETPLN